MHYLTVFLIAVAAATAHVKCDAAPSINTTIEQYPHQVSIANIYGIHFCGGSLVTRQHVLTAARCLLSRTPGLFIVRAGSTLATSGGDYYAVSKFQIHPDYKSTTLDYDVAVIKLQVPVKTNAKVQPISLAPSHAKPHPGEILISTGWALHQNNGRRIPSPLKMEHVKTLERSYCASIYADLLKITDTMICGQGDADKASLQVADIGGPIINGNRQLVAVVSREKLGTRFPGVYTDITNPRVYTFVEKNIRCFL